MKLTMKRRLPLIHLLAVALAAISLQRSTSAVAQESPAPSSRLTSIFAGGVPESVADLKEMESWQQLLVKRVTPYTVAVRIGRAQGSGVIISPQGLVLTAAHVAGQPGRPVEVRLHDGRAVRGTTLGMNRNVDAGMIQITDDAPNGADWPHASLGRITKAEDVKVGQWVMTIGHPGGYKKGRKPVLRVGRIVDVALKVPAPVIVTDCPLVGGDSGGPLFDMQGQVIGIHSRIGEQLTANMHVPISTYAAHWDRLAKGEAWGRLPGFAPFIGVQGDMNAEDARIVEVFPGTPAARAGVAKGDVILQFDDKQVGNFDSLKRLVDQSQPGKKVQVVVQRGEQRLSLELTVGNRP